MFMQIPGSRGSASLPKPADHLHAKPSGRWYASYALARKSHEDLVFSVKRVLTASLGAPFSDFFFCARDRIRWQHQVFVCAGAVQ
jgi:hypothetical protein